ncbi:MAG TPA: ribonuclease P protein component [Alphaproteobacteria bacterium]|nr:ribonuclease P protein component [Alphaproteobacteria bacterium]
MTVSLGRLTRRPEFLRVAAARRSYAAPGLVLQVLRREAGEDAGSVRLGLTASRKVGNAVARNRARRRLRAAANAVLPLRAEPGYDLVLIARAATAERPFALLLGDLETALRRLGVARGGTEAASIPAEQPSARPKPPAQARKLPKSLG